MSRADSPAEAVAAPTGNYHTQALSRGLRVLEEIATQGRPVTLSELHEATGLPKSTLVRLLAALTDLEYLVRVDDRPAYRLGHKVGSLSAAYLEGLDIEELVGAKMATLARLTRQTANLGILDGTEVVHVAVHQPDRLLRYAVNVGERSAARITGLGKAILAFLPASELTSHVEPEPWADRTSHAKATLAELRADLTRTRRRGHAVDDNEFAEGLFCVAVPLLVDDYPVAALSVSGASGEFTRARQQEFVDLLRTTADELCADASFRDALSSVNGATRRHR